mgnify:CR=1 FL=1
MDNSMEKYNDLLDVLKNLNNVAVAYSGGVDSSLLLFAATKVLKKNVIAVTAAAPFIPKWEVEDAQIQAGKFNVRHIVFDVDLPLLVSNNPPDRCYHCKLTLFSMMMERIRGEGDYILIDGSNADEINEYRPGFKALKELGVRSPMVDAGLTKQNIRYLSKMFGLDTWDKPAYACLLSRIPYNTEITPVLLERIENAEKFLIDLGIKAVRVRSHGDLARIEAGEESFELLLDRDVLKKIAAKLKEFGYMHITVDCDGYKMGCFDEF